MNIALFIDSSEVGGIENHVLLLAKQLNKNPCDQVVIFVGKNYHNSPLVRIYRDAGIEVIDMDGKLNKLTRSIKNFRIDILHTHSYKTGIIGRFTALMGRVKCISTFHNGDFGSGKLALYTWLDRATSLLSTNIAVSQEIQKRLPKKTTVLNNFVDLPEVEHRISTEKTTVAFVGRLHKVKRVDRFIKLAKNHPYLNFEVFGDGNEMAWAKSHASENVTFHGFVENTDTIWKGIDLLVICSDVEGLPLAALEAMANHVPVVSLAIGQLPHVIEHGVNGFICESVDELTQNITKWTECTDQQKMAISKSARLTIEQKYSSETGCHAVRALYLETVI
jgi:glycosyltransferase involved in cell wall biosynthesis